MQQDEMHCDGSRDDVQARLRAQRARVAGRIELHRAFGTLVFLTLQDASGKLQLGLSKKCQVLDLDNTLWGGVVGDDGLGGIRLGQGDPEAEAFQEIQRYARGLRVRGVFLAVCSANEEKNA